MTSQRSHWVMLPLSRDVCGMGFFGRGKGSEVDVSSINLNARLPLAFTKSFCTYQAGGAVTSGNPLVLAIFGSRHVSQVCNSVVVGDAIDVVNVASGPFAMNVEPRKTMLSVNAAFKANASVSLRLGDIPRPCPSLRKLIAADKPDENTRLRVVAQKLFQFLLGDYIFRFSHVIAPSQRCFGEGLAGAGNTFLPRFNIGRAA